MNLKKLRITDFLNWCTNVKFTKPLTRGYLSKEYMKETGLQLYSYYFCTKVSIDEMTNGIRYSQHSLEVQARLMCLFALPVDEHFFNELNQPGTIIELDENRRITKYKCGTTKIECVHDKRKKCLKSDAQKLNRSDVEEGFEENGYEDFGTPKPSQFQQVSSNGSRKRPNHFDLDLDYTFQNPQRPCSSTAYTGNNSFAHPTGLISPRNENNLNFGSVQEPSNNHFANLYDTFASSQQPNTTSRAASKMKDSNLQGLISPKNENNLTFGSAQEPKNNSFGSGQEPKNNSFGSVQEPKNNSFVHETTSQSAFEPFLHNLEYFFLYKFRPEFQKLCMRIKEIKENEARFSRKVIQESTIKSFFEVHLRTMVANLNQNIGAIKMEPETREALVLNQFLNELKDQVKVNGTGEVIDSIQAEENGDKMITYDTIAKAFMNMINSLAHIC